MLVLLVVFLDLTANADETQLEFDSCHSAEKIKQNLEYINDEPSFGLITRTQNKQIS